MVLRYNENIGTGSADAFTGFTNNIYFGLNGDDRFGVFPGHEFVFFVGGPGADTYYAASSSAMVVADFGNSPGDLIVAPSIGFTRATSAAAIIDGRHLLVGDAATRTFVYVIDWLDPRNHIEFVQAAEGLLSLNDVVTGLTGVPVTRTTWEGLANFGFVGLKTSDVSEAIAFYASRATQVLNAQPGGSSGASALFDSSFYLSAYADVRNAGIDALTHFQQFGWKEGRDPNPYLDVSWYLARYLDVAAAGLNPVDHYLQHGWKENRDPGPGFDTSSYLALNPDVAAAGLNPLVHFLQFGRFEGRPTAAVSSPLMAAPEHTVELVGVTAVEHETALL